MALGQISPIFVRANQREGREIKGVQWAVGDRIKAGFSNIKSAESVDFSRTILQKGMPFCRIIR